MHIVAEGGADRASYIALLKNGNFLRFFLAQSVSSLGDWTGVIAIAVMAQRIGGTTAVGAVMTARVLPGFLVGPLAGVAADRWDRRKMMVVADLLRAIIIFSLPFVPNLLYLLIASAVLESLTLVWGPAKDASLPHFVPRGSLTHANSLSLIAVYAPMPLASVLFASMASFGAFLGTHVDVMRGLQGSNEALALWVDSLTFVFSAVMVSTLTIPSSRRRGERFDIRQVRTDLFEGLRFVRDHRQVRPWMLGIAFTFTAAGGVFSLGVEFVEKVLGGGETGFAFLIGFLGTGMILGLTASGLLARRIQRDVLFSSALFLLGAALMGLASVGSLDQAIPVASALGFFGGVGYSTGYALMQDATADELRGRTFGAAYTLIRIGTLLGLGIFPFIAGAIGNHQLHLGNRSIPLPGSRITLWIAGLVVVGGGAASLRAIRARSSPPDPPVEHSGFLIAFEGGEGSGKSTQMAEFIDYLRERGHEVVATREPGGTPLGSGIRSMLLEYSAGDVSPRAEALLYAADRAQHVDEVIRPALDAGRIVVSDRFVDSSLAYQGIARGLGLDEIHDISAWATANLWPDLVFFLAVDPAVGLQRSGQERDRIESEPDEFHRDVVAAYHRLAERYSDRFVVIDAAKPLTQVHQAIVKAFEERAGARVVSFPSR